MPARHIAGQRRAVHQLELELGRLAQQVLERLWVLQAGHLHHDAVAARPDDRRLARAEGVDALAYDFDPRFPWPAPRLDRRLRASGSARSGLPSITLIVQSRCPVSPAPLVSGRIASRTASTLAGFSTRKVSAPSRFEISLMRMSPPACLSLFRDRFVHALNALLAHLRWIGFEENVAAACKIEPEVDLGRIGCRPAGQCPWLR